MKQFFMATVLLMFVSNIFANQLSTNEQQVVGVQNEDELIEESIEAQYQQRSIPAHVYPGMSYREIKKYYDRSEYNSYFDTKYSPFWSGFASYCITGLGQACCGEFWRGLAFWAGKWALTAAFVDANGKLTGASVIAYYGVSIWSIIDASRVAKIKSMYHTDMRRSYRSDVSIGMYPSLNCTPLVGGIKATPCMTLSVAF